MSSNFQKRQYFIITAALSLFIFTSVLSVFALSNFYKKDIAKSKQDDSQQITYSKSSQSDKTSSSSESKSSEISSSSVLKSVQSSSATQTNKIVEKKVKIPVLMYHRINDLKGISPSNGVEMGLRVHPDIFDKQIKYITEKGYKTITVEDLHSYNEGKLDLPLKPIIITLDDGYKDNIEKALPVLQKYKQVGDFAIITSVVGKGGYMNWDDLKTLKKAGMGISSHTLHHCYLAVNKDSKTGPAGPFADSPVNDREGQSCPGFAQGGVLNTGQIRGELATSKAELEKNLDIKVHGIVYPYGKYNQQVIDISKNLGYTLGFTVETPISKLNNLLKN